MNARDIALLSEDELRAEARQAFRDRGAATAFAARHGLVDETVFVFLRGKRPASSRLARALGYRKLTVYVSDSDGSPVKAK